MVSCMREIATKTKGVLHSVKLSQDQKQVYVVEVGWCRLYRLCTTDCNNDSFLTKLEGIIAYLIRS